MSPNLRTRRMLIPMFTSLIKIPKVNVFGHFLSKKPFIKLFDKILSGNNMTHSSTEKNLNLDFSFKFFDAILSILKTANFNL